MVTLGAWQEFGGFSPRLGFYIVLSETSNSPLEWIGDLERLCLDHSASADLGSPPIVDCFIICQNQQPTSESSGRRTNWICTNQNRYLVLAFNHYLLRVSLFWLLATRRWEIFRSSLFSSVRNDGTDGLLLVSRKDHCRFRRTRTGLLVLEKQAPWLAGYRRDQYWPKKFYCDDCGCGWNQNRAFCPIGRPRTIFIRA